MKGVLYCISNAKMVLPVVWMLFRRAFTENGDMNSLSKDNDRAINAMAFAVICSLTALLSPSHWNEIGLCK